MKRKTFLLFILAALALTALQSNSQFMGTGDGVVLAATQQADSQVISVANAAKVKSMAVLGRGRNLGVRWTGDSKNLIVLSAIGLAVYKADDLETPLASTPISSDYVVLSSEIGKTLPISQDGRIAAFPNFDLATYTNQIQVWDTSTGKPPLVLKGRDANALNYLLSKDGSFVVSLDYSNNFILWSTSDGKQIGKFKSKLDYTREMALSDDGKMLALARKSAVSLFSLPDGKPGKVLQAAQDVSRVAFSPDGSLLMADTYAEQKTQLVMWNVASGQPVEWMTKAALNGTLAFSPDGKYLLFTDRSKNSNGALDVLDPATGDKIATLPITNSYRGQGPVVSGDSKWVVDCNPGKVKIFETATGKASAFAFPKMQGVLCNGAAFSPDNKSLALVDSDGGIWTWDVEGGAQIKSREGDAKAGGLIFSPDSKTLFITGEGLWDVETSKFISARHSTQAIYPFDVIALSLGRIGGLYQTDGAFSADSKTALYLDRAGTIHAIDVADGKETGTVKLDGVSNGFKGQCTLSSVGAAACLSSDTGDVTLYDMATGKLTSKLTGERPPAPPSKDGQDRKTEDSSLKFSGDGKLLAAFESTGTRLWNVSSGKLLAAIPFSKVAAGGFNYDSGARSLLAFSPDSKDLMTSSLEPTQLALWDIDGNRARKALRIAGVFNIQALLAQYSPDGKLLALSSSTMGQSAFVLANASTGKILNTLKGHTGLVFSFAFSPDGKYMASIGVDGTVRLWTIGPDTKPAK